MKQEDNLLRTVIYKGITVIIAFLTVVILAGTVMKAQEKVFSTVLTPWTKYGFLAVLIIVIGGIYIRLFRMWNHMERRGLIISTIVMALVIIGIYMALWIFLEPFSSADAYNMQDLALYLAQTGAHKVTPEMPHANYFGYFSNNYFLTILLSKYMKILLAIGITDMYRPLYMLTTIAMLAATLFLYLTGVKVAGLKGGAGVLLFCAMNPLYYLMPYWVYTNTLSIPFTAGVVYFSVRLFREKNRRDRIVSLIFLAVCAVVGYYIRATVVIPVIAFFACFLAEVITGKRKFMQMVQNVGVFILVSALLAGGISAVNRSYFSEISDQNIPITHWIMMAAHGDGMHSSEDYAYTKSFQTKEEKSAAAKEKIREYYSSYTATELIKFLHKKLVISWCYADGGDLLSRLYQDRKNTTVYDWLAGDKSDLFQMYAYAFRLVNLGLILAAFWKILRKRRIDVYPMFLAISFLGGICFYSLWEVKSSYGMPFVMFLLLLGAYGLQEMTEKEKSTEVFDMQHAFRWGRILGLAVVCCVTVVGVRQMYQSRVVYRDWSVRCVGASTKGTIKSEDDLHIKQTFYTEKPFNQIGLEMKEKEGNPDDYVVVSLADENGQELYRTQIGANQIKDGQMLYLSIPTVVPEKKHEKYQLEIWNEKPLKGTIQISHRKEFCMGGYEGDFTNNGQSENGRLYLQVFSETEQSWCSGKVAVLIAGIICILTGWIMWPVKGKRNE